MVSWEEAAASWEEVSLAVVGVGPWARGSEVEHWVVGGWAVDYEMVGPVAGSLSLEVGDERNLQDFQVETEVHCQVGCYCYCY